MNLESTRSHCKSLLYVTEDMQWESLLFRIANKIFCLVALEPISPTKICFKCTPERFSELVECEGIIPAPYMARNHWVALTSWTALRDEETRQSIDESYRLILSKLPRKKQAELSGMGQPPKAASKSFKGKASKLKQAKLKPAPLKKTRRKPVKSVRSR